jgi:inhibitor of cysteine peptidase
MNKSSITLILCCALLAAVNVTSPSMACPGAADGVETIIVTRGEEFIVTLESNPTTGYQWRLAQPLDEKVLKLIKSNYQPDRLDLTGSPGRERWAFLAVSSGQATLSFEYVRPWEKNVPPARVARFRIVVGE